jgi:hypothetical protein
MHRRLHHSEITHIVIPLYPRFELSETKVDLDAEHDRPVCLAVLAMFRLCTSTEGRQIGPHYTQSRIILWKNEMC